ncbi:LTA synthase family protein [Weissella paramesenteroides]|uniref:LTA synthase family protein n=1 Tax=Weissella paramesenteroides TaxID=1249 RepID=UPI0039829833
MKKFFNKWRLTGPTFNNWMKLLIVGLILSVVTTVSLQFTMYFQVWRHLQQTTDFGQAFLLSVRYLERPQAIFTILVWLLIYAFILALVNRFFVGVSIYATLAIIVILAEYMKMKSRNEPILFSDMSEVTAVGGLTQMVDKNLLIISVVGIIIVFVSAILLEFWINRRKAGKFADSVKRMMFKQTGLRIVILLITFIPLAAPFIANADQNRALLNHFKYGWTSFNTGEDAMYNGPVMTFVSNISSVIMRQPSDYSKKNMLVLQKKYTKYSNELNKTRHSSLKGQTVAYILSESLTNPNDVPKLKYSGTDVFENINQIQKKSVFSGKMLSSGYGGGTANIEYMTLAGFPLATFAPEMVVPYTQMVPFAHETPTIANLFQQREVIHPYVGTFYNRRDAYKKIGIQKFYTTDGKQYKYPNKFVKNIGAKTNYPADKYSYEYLEKKIDGASNNKSQFLQLMTMQNHMPYSANQYPNSKYSVSEPTMSDGTKETVESYISGVHYTDVATKKLIQHLENMSRPVTLIFYGDHWPGVFTFIDQDKQLERSHETDYFIYQNKAAREKSRAKVNHNQRAYASPSDFPALALEATNSKLTPLFALQTKVTNELPAFANYTRGEFVDNNGHTLKTKDLSKKQRKLLHEFKLVQYDLSAGKHYLSEKFTKSTD